MAEFDSQINKILKALGLETSSIDSGQADNVRKVIKDVANSAKNNSNVNNNTSSGLSGTINTLNSFVRALDYSSSVSANFNANILDLGANLASVGESLLEMDFTKLFGSLKSLASPFIELDQSLRNQINKDLGLTGNLARGIRSTMIETAEETLRYGINVGDVTDSYTSFVSTLGRAVPLNKELLEDITMSARASGVSMSTAGDFLAKLENYGLSIQSGPKTLTEMSETARSMGLTTNKFMAYAAENLKLINTLGFDKGVKGFTEIAAKASSVGFNLQTAASSAEKLFDIDSAVEMAAQLNVLGGDFGRLGNAIDLMFMPTNDMEGFTDGLMKATQQFVTFNEEKNTFDVSPLDLRRAREFAKATGMSLEEVIETGKRMSKMELIKDRISFIPNLSDEERDLIGSLGQLNDSGDVTIKGKVISEMTQTEVTQAINSLKQEDAKGKMSQKDILNEQLNMFSKMNNYLKAIAIELGAFDSEGGMFTLLGDDLNDLIYSVTGGENEDMFKDLTNVLMRQNSEGFEGAFTDFESQMTASQMTQWESIKSGFETIKSGVQGYMGVNNKFDGFSAALSEGSAVETQLQVQNSFNPTIVIDGIGYALTRDQQKFVDRQGREYTLSASEGNTTTVVGDRND